MGNNKYNMIGEKFNMLTVLEECEERKDRKKVYKCLCDCGNVVNVIGTNLRNGHSKSCGCLSTQILKDRSITHGKSNTRLYRIYYNMKTRCNNQNNEHYNNWCKRGITVCDEWSKDFMTFHDWAISHGYSDNLTIDRIDNNKGYSPDNCRWVTNLEQQNNTRKNVYLTYNGKTQTIAQWSRELNVRPETIWKRHHKGWSDKECLFGKEV